MKKLLTTTYGAAIGAMVLLSLLFVATLMPIPGNVKIKVVKSGSMEPAVHVGSVVVIKPEASYQVGDVITFGKDTKTQIPTTHRIVRISGEGSGAVFVTKGDANDAEDNATTHLSDIEGKMLVTVPYVGYALAFLRTKLGFFLLVGVPALAVFAEEGRSLYFELKRIKLRRRRQVSRVEETPPRSPDVRRKRIMTIGLAATIAIGAASIGSAYGNTFSYYVNSATSGGNMMRAGVFPIKKETPPSSAVPLSVEVSVSDLTVDEPSDTPPPEDIVPLEESEPPAVEVSTTDASLTE